MSTQIIMTPGYRSGYLLTELLNLEISNEKIFGDVYYRIQRELVYVKSPDALKENGLRDLAVEIMPSLDLECIVPSSYYDKENVATTLSCSGGGIHRVQQEVLAVAFVSRMIYHCAKAGIHVGVNSE